MRRHLLLVVLLPVVVDTSTQRIHVIDKLSEQRDCSSLLIGAHLVVRSFEFRYGPLAAYDDDGGNDTLLFGGLLLLNLKLADLRRVHAVPCLQIPKAPIEATFQADDFDDDENSDHYTNHSAGHCADDYPSAKTFLAVDHSLMLPAAFQ